LEAELACTVDGVKLESSNEGFLGQGYVNTTNAIGAAVTWIVNSDIDKTTTLSFRYANGDSTNRDGQLSINGITASNLLLPSTGDWIVWEVVSVNVALKKGANTIKVAATSATGLANLDLIYLPAGVTSSNCVITGIDGNSTYNSELFVYPNPTQNKVNWHSEQNWILINPLGIEIKNGNGTEVDLSLYPNGMYHLKLGNKVFNVLKR
jgi:hypothetical protein